MPDNVELKTFTVTIIIHFWPVLHFLNIGIHVDAYFYPKEKHKDDVHFSLWRENKQRKTSESLS